MLWSATSPLGFDCRAYARQRRLVAQRMLAAISGRQPRCQTNIDAKRVSSTPGSRLHPLPSSSPANVWQSTVAGSTRHHRVHLSKVRDFLQEEFELRNQRLAGATYDAFA